MRVFNFWTLKAIERPYLKVIEWAQRHGRPVQALTKAEIQEALKCQR